ncbi:hypothetical protein OSB04_003683 [Centaurea solstitialis]|uniref:RING-type E3 ubiquitin transferase n=1 Tax=Centaurea solstitialis TaxID=347529 RepID=A0AA38UCG6_9ASTR|nr:hypothetical protein OSB04_003683 [Centaurea solstitialis]
MQGQKGGFGSLPESLGLEHGSGSSDMYTNQESQNVSMWTVGESSSSSLPNHMGQGLGLGQGQGQIEPKTDHGWPPLMKETPAASMLSLGDVNMNITHNHANNGHHGPFFVQTPVPHNVNPINYAETYVGSNASSSSSLPNPLGQQLQLQLPCKRKAAELGQPSSRIGSSSTFLENPPPANATHSDQIIPRLGLGVPSDNQTVENATRRNVRIRVNASRQQDPLPANNNTTTTNNNLNPVDVRLTPTMSENSSGQPVLQLPALRRNLQESSRWNRSSSSSRANRSLNFGISGDYPRTNISDHPIFVQPNGNRNAAINWNANNNGTASTRTGSNPVPVASSTAPNSGPHRGSPHYPSRRLSEILRRSLLSSIESNGGGGQISNLFSRIPPAVGTSLQEAGIVGRHHVPQSRSSIDGAFGLPYVARSVGSERRGRLVSEIRNVLDLIRRGEGLRFEDVMILDESMLYGMGDRHRDMRLDIDNMSYEELLALEERIGNVNTGLTEETISGCLKQKTYVSVPDAEPCCICQEEYKNGDDIGGLGCGHDFHRSCIKKWLLQKNLCPVCKSAAIADTTTSDK